MKRFIIPALMIAAAAAASADVIHDFQFGDADGTPIGNAADSANAATFGGSKAFVATDGAGALILSDAGTGSTADNYFSVGQPIVGGGDTGTWEFEYHLNSADLSTSTNAANFGFGIRHNANATSSSRDIALVRFGVENNEIKLSTRMDSSNTTLFQGWDTKVIGNVTVRAVVTLNGASAGTLDVYATDDDVDLGSGVGAEHLFDQITLSGGKTVDSLRFFTTQFSGGADVWGASDTASIDHFTVTLVPEPSTLGLFGLALGSMLLSRVRR